MKAPEYEKENRRNCIANFKWLYILRELLNLLEMTIFVTESQLDLFFDLFL